MLDIRTLEALEELFTKEPHSIGRYKLTISVDYGTISVEEDNTLIAELEERIQELENKLDEISSLANY